MYCWKYMNNIDYICSFSLIRLNLTRFISDSSQCTLESYWFSIKGHFSVDFYEDNFCMRLCQNIQKVRIREIFRKMFRSKINIESESDVFCKWSSFEKSDILNCYSLKTTSPCLCDWPNFATCHIVNEYWLLSLIVHCIKCLAQVEKKRRCYVLYVLYTWGNELFTLNKYFRLVALPELCY